MRYKAKYVEIDAIQWNGANVDEIREFTENGFNISSEKVAIEIDQQEKPVAHKTISVWAEVWDYIQADWVNVNLNDYIIKGTENEFYPCAEKVFNRKYELKGDENANELGLFEGKLKK